MIQDSLRHRVMDSSVGWVSTSDTLLFGFGSMLVVAVILAAGQKKKDAAYGVLEREQEALLSRAALLDRDLATANSNAKRFSSELEQTKRKSQQALKVAQDAVNALRKKLESLNSTHLELVSRFEKARVIHSAQKKQIASLLLELSTSKDERDRLKGIETEYGVLLANYEALQATYEQKARTERRVRSELIGLKGKLSRVAILFDGSQSMKEGGRWDSGRKVMSDWLEYLDMEQCALIVFQDGVQSFPANATMLQVNGEEGSVNRNKMRTFLQQIEPAGRTNTLEALKAAYRLTDIDTIVLFTDGAPYIGVGTARSDPAMIEAIYELCEAHPDIPINAVGLGDYFSPELSSFLLKVTELTGGTFIGK